MATWAKENVIIHLVTATTLADDSSAHDVEVIDTADSLVYDAGSVVACTQGSTADYRYFPSSDLDTTKEYDVYVDTVKIGRIIGPDRTTMVGG